MKNGLFCFILLIFCCLTSCKPENDNTLTDEITSNVILPDHFGQENKPFGLPDPSMNDTSKYYFFIENTAGSIDYQRYDFTERTWRPVSALMQEVFIGGPLHSGRIIHQQELWKDSFTYFLLGKTLPRGMSMSVQPLAKIEVNNDPAQTLFLLIPEEEIFRLSSCDQFDDWFTHCNQQRFFVQYWIEQQYGDRYLQRIQWKPFEMEN